jgi:hypothetical protein
MKNCVLRQKKEFWQPSAKTKSCVDMIDQSEFKVYNPERREFPHEEKHRFDRL